MIEEALKNHKKIYPIQLDLPGAGFGAILLTTMNMVRYCERHNLYPAVCYDSTCNNAFFDPDYGNELWNQYFEPVMELSYHSLQQYLDEESETKTLHKLTSTDAIKISEEHPDSIYSFPFGRWRFENLGDLDTWYADQRKKGRETMKKYIKPKAHIIKKIDAFYQKHLQGCFVLGIHIRGTDLHYAPAVSPAEYFPHIDGWIKKEPSLKIFLATDQAQYISVFEKRYGKKVVYSDSFRSDNATAPFQRKELSPYKKGEDVLLDILLLSKSDFLIKGSSNVGEMALYFNEKLECLDLAYQKTKAFGQDYGNGWDNMTNLPAWKLISARELEQVSLDANSQSTYQSLVFNIRKVLKRIRVLLGAIKSSVVSR